MNTKRIAVLIGLILVVLLGAIAFAAWYVLHSDLLDEKITDLLQRQLGRPVQVSGQLDLQEFPVPGVSFGDVHIGGDGEAGPVVRVRRVRVSLELPVTEGSAPEKNVREAVEMPVAVETEFRALRVLVAEDNRVNLVAIQKFLEYLGHEPVMVTDGVQVVEALRGKDSDCVLMDVQMPVMDGIEATKRIRSDVPGTLPKDIHAGEERYFDV